MAPGSWSAPGKEYALALASGAVYCSRSGATLSTCKRADLALPACSWEPRV